MKNLSIKYNLLFSYANIILVIINGIVFVPYYLKYINLSEYGAWLASGNIISLLSIFGGGIDIMLVSKLSSHYAKSDKISFIKELSSTLVISFLTCVFFIILGIITSFFITSIINANQFKIIVEQSFRLALIGFVFNYLFLILKSIPLAMLNTKIIGFIELFSKLIGMMVLIKGIYSGFGILSFAYQQIFTGLLSLSLTSILVFVLLRKDKLIGLKFDMVFFKQQLNIIVPSLIGRSGSVIIQNLSLPIISNILNSSTAGMYAITNRLYDACLMVFTPIGNSFFPTFSSEFAKSKTTMSTYFNKVSKHFLGVILISIFFVFIVNRLFITWWVGADKFLGETINLFFSLNVLIQILNNYSGLGLISIGQQLKTVWYGFLDIGIRIIVLMLLIYFGFGAISMPIAQIVSIGFITFYLFRFLYKTVDNDFYFSSNSVFFSVLFFFIAAIIVYLISKYSNMQILPIFILLLYSYYIIRKFELNSFLKKIFKENTFKLNG